jgi:hypothetical protein
MTEREFNKIASYALYVAKQYKYDIMFISQQIFCEVAYEGKEIL